MALPAPHRRPPEQRQATPLPRRTTDILTAPKHSIPPARVPLSSRWEVQASTNSRTVPLRLFMGSSTRTIEKGTIRYSVSGGLRLSMKRSKTAGERRRHMPRIRNRMEVGRRADPPSRNVKGRGARQGLARITDPVTLIARSSGKPGKSGATA